MKKEIAMEESVENLGTNDEDTAADITVENNELPSTLEMNRQRRSCVCVFDLEEETFIDNEDTAKPYLKEIQEGKSFEELGR